MKTYPNIKVIRKCLLFIVGLLSLSSISLASIIAYDGFATGTTSGGTGWSGGWSGGSIPVTSPTLSFGDLSTESGKISSGWVTMERDLNLSISNGEVVWVSFLMSAADATAEWSGGSSLSLYYGSGGNDRIIAEMGFSDGDPLVWNKSNGVGNGDNLPSFSANTPIFFVIKITGTANGGTFESYGYTTASSVPTTAPSGGTATDFGSGSLTITKVGLNNWAGSVEYDEIRFADSYDDVIEGIGSVTPVEPTNLSANAAGSTGVNLSWSGQGDFIVERSTSSGSGFSQIGTSSDTNYSDSNLTTGTEYFYRVRLSTGGSYSNVASATPQQGSGGITKSGSNRIFAIGDSITYGVGNQGGSTPGGYRTTLYDLLQGDGYTFEFVGPHTSNGDGNKVLNHYGVPGITQISMTSDLFGGYEGWPPTWENSSVNFSSYNANIALVMLGTNDVRSDQFPDAGSNFDINYMGTNAEGFVDDGGSDRTNQANQSVGPHVRYMIEQMFATGPSDLTIFLAKIPAHPNTAFANSGWGTGRSVQDGVDLWNQDIENMVNYYQGQGRNIVLVDNSGVSPPYGGVPGGLSGGDGIHPDSAGYQQIAQNFFAAIQSQTGSGTPTAPNTPTSLNASASTSSITLTWNDNSSNEDNFVLERSANGSSGWTVINSSINANDTSETDSPLNGGDTWYYRVKATNAQGDSSYSNVANATVGAGGGGNGNISKTGPNKILSIGDSITYGTNGGGWTHAYTSGGAPWSWTGNTAYGPGYRAYLMDLLNQGGFTNWEYVGTRTVGGGGDASDSNDILSGNMAKHEGYPGNRSDHLKALIVGGTYFDAGGNNATGTPYTLNVGSNYPGHLDQIDTPNIVLMMLGTNDVIQGSYQFGAGATNADKALSTINSNIGAIVDGLYAANSDVVIFAAKIPELTGGGNNLAGHPRTDAVSWWNQGIDSFVTTKQGEGVNIHVVDMYAAVTQSNLADTVHPNTPGYIEMAQAWYNAIDAQTGGGSSGGYSSWASSEGVGSENADDDGDGISNFIEYAFDMDPNSEGMNNVPTVAASGSNMVLTFTDGQSGVTYQPQISTNLTTWSDYGSAITGDASGTTTVNIPQSQMVDGKLFIRLEVTE